MQSRSRKRHTQEQVDVEALRRLTILSVLPEGVLDDLAAQSRCEHYRRGEQIEWGALHTEPHVLGVLQGEVELSFLSDGGRDLPIVRLGRCEIVDLGPHGWTDTDATMVTTPTLLAVVCFLPYGAFEHAVTASCEAMRLLLAAHRRWLRELGGIASDRLHLNPDVRIRHILWRDSVVAPTEGIHYVQAHLAARAGTDQPRVSKEIKRLCREGVIEVGPKGRIHVIVRDRLIEE